MKKHVWCNDVCKHCGIVRKKHSALSPNLIDYGVGQYFYNYYVNGKKVDTRPECIIKYRKL